MAPGLSLFGCCVNDGGVAKGQNEFPPAARASEVASTTSSSADDPDDELLMPPAMMETYFARVKKQLRDLERRFCLFNGAAPAAAARAPPPCEGFALREFLEVVDSCQAILDKEKAAVLRSYKRSKELLRH